MTELKGFEKENKFEKFAEKIKGKKVVLYGPSWSGKTTLIVHTVPYLGATLYIDTDQNYPLSQVFEKLKANVVIRQVNDFSSAIKAMRKFEGDTVVVDSLAGLIAQLYEKEGTGSPRINLLSAQWQEQLIRTCKKFNTAIIITHVGADFRTGGERIRINQALLRYIDAIVKLDVINGKRVIKIQERTVVEKPDFEF